MILFLLLFFFIVLFKMEFAKIGFHQDFLSKSKTETVKGIFIIVVFINHIQEYYLKTGADLSAWYDKAFFLPARAVGQLMVVMFLFYSGYGVTESIKRKGKEYVKHIPKRRVLGTLVNFDIAVIIFTLVCYLISIKVGLIQFLLSLIGWSSVGNSNWYIFCITICYALSYIAYQITERAHGVIMLCLLVVGYSIFLSFFKGTWWYNTVFAYAAGAVVSEYNELLIDRFRKMYIKYLLVIGLCFALCLTCYLLFYGPFKSYLEVVGAMVFNVMSVFFALLVVLVTMKLSIHNKVLEWLGSNLFPLYIYQRLPMMVLATLFPSVLVASHPYVFLLLCIGITGCIAWGYQFIQIKLR